MGIILGFASLFFFLLLSAKALTKRLHFHKADNMLMRAHKAFSGLLFLGCFMHILFVFPVLKNRNVSVMVSGLAAVLSMFLLTALCHMIKDAPRKMQWHRILDMVMLLCLLLHILFYYADFRAYKQKIEDMVFTDIRVETIADGIYEGEYDAGYIYVRAEVEVRGGKLVSITLLEHRNERGEDAERITDDMLERQEIDVDAVSGATNSSNVIKKAVENALFPALRGLIE